MKMSLIAVFTVLALVAAACGSGNEQAAPGARASSDQSSVLPPNSNPDDTPTAAGACIADEPDCEDTAVPGGDPSDLPPPADTPDEPSPTGMLVDGGLSVADALATDASGVIAVKGLLLIDDQGARLCELFAESAPPLCGGALILVTNYEEVLSVPLTSAQGVSWTDQLVSFLGEIVDGTLVVDPTVAQ